MDKECPPHLNWLPRLLQVSDSAFPTGGYAHSHGFEQVVRFGLVHDEPTLRQFLARHVWPMLVHFELPVIRFSQDASLAENEAALLELDGWVEATKTAREIREASRAMGRRRLLALMETGPHPLLARFAYIAGQGQTPAHHTVVYGLGLAAMPREALLASWAFQNLQALCQAAPKLIRIGQNGVQRVLTSALEPMNFHIEQSLLITREDFGWFDPALELASHHHEIAYERLFIS